MKSSNTDSEILDSPQAASFLQITLRTLREWRNKRGLPYLRITAKELRYRKADILAWMDRFHRGVA